jgi:hypothetical protein
VRGVHHFVSEDSVDAIVVEVDEPVQALNLVLAHLAKLDDGWLRRKAVATASLTFTSFIRKQLGILRFLVLLIVSVPLLAAPV